MGNRRIYVNTHIIIQPTQKQGWVDGREGPPGENTGTHKLCTFPHAQTHTRCPTTHTHTLSPKASKWTPKHAKTKKKIKGFKCSIPSPSRDTGAKCFHLHHINLKKIMGHRHRHKKWLHLKNTLENACIYARTHAHASATVGGTHPRSVPRPRTRAEDRCHQQRSGAVLQKTLKRGQREGILPARSRKPH